MFRDFLHYNDIATPQNGMTFITGKSGSGKSTLLKLLNCTEMPSCGEILYRSESVHKRDPIEHRKEVILVPQEVYLNDGTVKDNFDFYHAARGEQSPSDDEMRRALSICSFDCSVSDSCNSMSGGERARVFTAIFLSMRPKVLMLDEPCAALDEQNAQALLEGVKTHCAAEGIACLVICHNPSLVSAFADNTVCLDKVEVQGD